MTLQIRILFEIENRVNSRPLTYLPIDSEEDHALTPNNFLRPYDEPSQQLGDFDDKKEPLKFQWMTSQLVANRFWKRFVLEYLPVLNRRVKWCQSAEPLKVDDVVIVIDENQPSHTWSKGKIVEAKNSKDGQVRKAIVKTSSGLYERPSTRLAKLDISVPMGTAGEC